MATLSDALALRAFWTRENLSKHDGHWIAFQSGDVIGRNEALAPLLEQFGEAIKKGDGPIFAHVDLRARI